MRDPPPSVTQTLQSASSSSIISKPDLSHMRMLIEGVTLSEYIAIANGFPCMVPSEEKMSAIDKQRIILSVGVNKKLASSPPLLCGFQNLRQTFFKNHLSRELRNNASIVLAWSADSTKPSPCISQRTISLWLLTRTPQFNGSTKNSPKYLSKYLYAKVCP